MNNILVITKKELKALLDNVTGYILLVLFVAVVYFFFLKSFFLISNASLRQLFQTLPWVLTIFVPAITMGSIAKEHADHTIEYLLTKPVTAIQVATGKILASTIFTSLALFLTIPLPYFVSKLGALDAGETVAGYTGAIILILAFSTIGVAVSSFFKNQITAFLTSIVCIFFLNILGSQLISINLPLSISNFLANLSVLEHFLSIARGVLQVQDIVYFFVVVLIALAITYINLMRIRVVGAKTMIKKFTITVGIVAILSGMIIYSSDYAKGRVDLTSTHKYTLSNVTKEVLAENGKVKLDVYVSAQMPSQFQSTLSELKNILNDYDRVGGKNLELQYLNPDDHLSELNKLQISPIRFNVYGKDELQVKQGYLALVIKNEDGSKQETIPYIKDISKLEYELTRSINKVKATDQPKIAFASGNGEMSIYSDYQALNESLKANFSVDTVFFTSNDEDSDKNVPDISKYDLLVIANPTAEYSDASKKAIIDYVNNGGKVLYLVNTVDVDTTTLTATPNSSRGKLFSDLGATVNSDLVYDLQYNRPVTINTSNRTLLYPYPLWVEAIASKNTDIRNLPQSVFYPWGSTLNLTGDDWKVLFSTSKYAGSIKENMTIDPQQQFDQTNLNSFPLIAEKEFSNGGKVVIAGNANFLTDQFIKGIDSNMVMATALSEDLAQTKPFSEIQSKNLLKSQFVVTDESKKYPVKYFSPLISLALIGILGTTRMSRRKRLESKYST